MRKIGYVRVSSVGQNPARQIQQLEEIGMDIIYEEKISGATRNENNCKKCLGIYRKVTPFMLPI